MTFTLRIVLAAFVLCVSSVSGQTQSKPPGVAGRWNLTVSGKDGKYPSWIEVRVSGRSTLVGAYVGEFGSARPVSEFKFADGRLKFEVPVQWESGRPMVEFDATLSEGTLKGTISDSAGMLLPVVGVRAPALVRKGTPVWGQPITLFDGTSMSAWKLRSPPQRGTWRVVDGLLTNFRVGNDLMTVEKFTDFKALVEFKVDKGANSGIYLRGRYEVQIEQGDDPPSPLNMGALYGHLIPRVNASKGPGEWQTYEITLVGRRVTVMLNGELIHDRQEIPGITGGAIDSDEGNPGPLLIQGDHALVWLRKVVVTPVTGWR